MENVTSNSLSKFEEKQSPIKLIKIMSKQSIPPSKLTKSYDIFRFENYLKTEEFERIKAKSEWLGQ